ncbi:hypothetical protein B7755_001505 [Streptomyces sp. NBS 14/10]|uniref:hypothetical protein n=1 Tax=Streptomyces sp. NBS 14/10 TaxID=1945643 RepID=UPI00117FE40E|nr:hypothetical protein [Streptomyces sp. NBS 14/10]KAK1176968.1 hypothetical protein B7755_001505 [Streptomyces sp. NBS 14/10]NUS87975.1 hypothetical protein [Streptomyces sp.]
MPLVTAMYRGILRAVEDIYRRVVTAVSGTPPLGIDTRRQTTQRAVRQFTDRGIGWFTDKADRMRPMTTRRLGQLAPTPPGNSLPQPLSTTVRRRM